MEKEILNPLFAILEQTFEKSAQKDLEENYIKAPHNQTKWTCFSDYCFDDDGKPNDVCCFTLLPYIDYPDQLAAHVATLAKADIKNTRKIDPEFIAFLKQYPLVNFSFIFSDKRKIFGQNHDVVKDSLRLTFEGIKEQYTTWSKNQPQERDHYAVMIKKLDCTLQLIREDKKIKQMVAMLLVTHYGAYVSSKVVDKNNLEVFGWISDRDAINEVCNGLSTDLFHYYLHGFIGGANFKYVVGKATSQDKPIFDELIRLPDYITGTLADYNMKDGLISKDKFETILTDYIAENSHNNFIFKVEQTDKGLTCSRIRFSKTT